MELDENGVDFVTIMDPKRRRTEGIESPSNVDLSDTTSRHPIASKNRKKAGSGAQSR